MIYKKLIGAVFCATVFSTTVSLANGTQEFTFKDHGEITKKISVEELKTLAIPVEKSVYDPLEQTTTTYKALPLNTVLEKIYGGKLKQAEELLFTCSDGYKPSIPQDAFSVAHTFLAFERVGQKSFSLINKLEGGKKIDLAPFYLIWDTGKNPNKEEWAYMVVGLDLINFEEHFPQIAPAKGSSVQVKRGFLSFRKNCLSCHTINGEGGGKAPELNYPVNVTEYYKESWLKKWIAQPSDIRFNTTMPAVMVEKSKLDSTIDDLVAYLKAMEKNKRAPKTDK